VLVRHRHQTRYPTGSLHTILSRPSMMARTAPHSEPQKSSKCRQGYDLSGSGCAAGLWEPDGYIILRKMASEDRHPAPPASKQIMRERQHEAVVSVIMPRGSSWTSGRSGMVLIVAICFQGEACSLPGVARLADGRPHSLATRQP